ncbi:unnamed protein product [Fraxinus pennsylvanica]|uniref:GIR1-like zinc ribbon domain-containing protein n=1 Tax=Fraxinus pennsylvanica TaxID=56036 RepID=A0AAD2E6U4_9LAMI|nr:unnamed protein product [Fraxinus pennsylvanica]
MNYNAKSSKLELKQNLSPPRANLRVQSSNRSISPIEISPRSSCGSREMSPNDTLCYSSSPEATSMMLVGCPRCLMYVMLFAKDPKCPKCKSTVLLDFLHEDSSKKSKK